MSYGLNIPVIKRLIYKDWYLNRKFIALYVLGSIIGLSMLGMGDVQYFMGWVFFLCMLICLSNHQLAKTMINERKEQTLSFVMSLPVSPMDYAVAKLCTNLLMYVVPWSLLLAVHLLMIYNTSVLDGILPFTVIISLMLLLNHSITWSVGMVTESEPIILVVMITLNCLLNPALYLLGRAPGVAPYIKGDVAVWTPFSTGLLLAEVVLVVLLLGLSVYLQSRKKVFY